MQIAKLGELEQFTTLDGSGLLCCCAPAYSDADMVITGDL